MNFCFTQSNYCNIDGFKIKVNKNKKYKTAFTYTERQLAVQSYACLLGSKSQWEAYSHENINKTLLFLPAAKIIEHIFCAFYSY